MAADACEAARMECLHEKCADTADEGGHVRVDDPGGFIREEESGIVAGLHCG